MAPPKFEHNRPGALPQLYADMFGWEPMAQKVAAYYNSLPAKSAHALESSRTIMARQAQSISSARVMDCPRQSAVTKIIGFGDRTMTTDTVCVVDTDGTRDER